jgi:hypothetical protein
MAKRPWFKYQEPARGSPEEALLEQIAPALNKASLATLKAVARELGIKGAEEHPLEGEVARVEQHFEQYSEVFRKVGATKAGLVAGFKAARQHAGPGLTADKFLGTRGGAV